MLKKYILLLILLISYNYNLLAINEYEILELGTIPIGNQTGMLGYDATKILPGYGPIRPTTYSISEDNYIYICDNLNQRINVYDLELNFIREIKGNGFRLPKIEKIKIDKEENIIAIISNFLLKIDKQGRKKFTIKKTKLSSEVMTKYNYFPFKDYIFFYDKDIVKWISPDGSIIENENDLNSISMLLTDEINSKLKIQGIEKILKYKNEKNIIFAGDKLLSTDFKKHKDYFDFLKSTLTDINFKDESAKHSYRSINSFIDYDSYSNSYWVGSTGEKRIILVFSKFGGLLDCFYHTRGVLPAVTSNGDIYTWEINEEGVAFYKIARRW